MKPIVYDFGYSNLNRKYEPISLKAGYLLGNVVCSAGNTGLNLRFGSISSGYTLSQKLDILIDVFHGMPDMAARLLRTKKAKKEADKVRNKSREYIGLQKNAEASVLDMYKLYINSLEGTMNAAGFEAVRTLDEDILRYYNVEPSSPEAPHSENITASNLLQRLLPGIKEDEEPEIFFLGSEFFKDSYSEYTLYTDGNEATLNTRNTCLYKCLSLPNFLYLSADKLKAIREHIQQARATFNEYMNEWIDMCYFGDAIPERISYCKENVLPSATALQQLINENEILKACPAPQGNNEQIELWIGEMPVQQLWNYYRHYKVIKEVTWNKLKKRMADETYRDQRWPVLILNVPDAMLEVPDAMLAAPEEKETPVEEIRASKKYILVD